MKCAMHFFWVLSDMPPQLGCQTAFSNQTHTFWQGGGGIPSGKKCSSIASWIGEQWHQTKMSGFRAPDFSSYSFDGIPAEKKFSGFYRPSRSHFKGKIFKTMIATGTISTPFQSCTQDLSYGGCNFSVSCLVPEILAKTCPQCHFGCGQNAGIRPKVQ